MRATWSQPVAEVVVFSNDLGSSNAHCSSVIGVRHARRLPTSLPGAVTNKWDAPMRGPHAW